jgi:hypothetical protein
MRSRTLCCVSCGRSVCRAFLPWGGWGCVVGDADGANQELHCTQKIDGGSQYRSSRRTIWLGMALGAVKTWYLDGKRHAKPKDNATTRPCSEGLGCRAEQRDLWWTNWKPDPCCLQSVFRLAGLLSLAVCQVHAPTFPLRQ